MSDEVASTYNFTMYGAFPESEGGSDMLFLVASPSAK